MNQYHWITPTNFAIAQFLVVTTTAAASILHVPVLYKVYRLYIVADCFDAVAITQTPCSAVVDDELFRRRKASTSADGTMLFDPQDAKEQ
ncbi:hypothetical protein AAVH_26159 [Aphelenchoides avenae]|nr:hypothetical protein AAVH_26159 [Aphelenchus avenae]